MKRTQQETPTDKNPLSENSLIEENAELIKRLKRAERTINFLKPGHNNTLIHGSNSIVTFHNSQAYVLWQVTFRVALNNVRKESKLGMHSLFGPILYATTNQRLAEQFHTTTYHIRPIVKFLTDCGAWKLIKRSREQICTYVVGEIIKSPEGYPVVKSYFNLNNDGRNLRCVTYYEKEKEARGIPSKVNVKRINMKDRDKKQKKSTDHNKALEIAKDFTDAINELTNKYYKVTKEVVGLVSDRLKEGYAKADFGYVIEVAWNDQGFNEKYFRPSTLLKENMFNDLINQRPDEYEWEPEFDEDI